MAIKPIVMHGNPVLHRPCRTVAPEEIPQLQELIADMYETMDKAHGVGLAANQIGVDLAIFVYACPDDEGQMHRGCVINPVLTTSELPQGPAHKDDDEEGCLSVPGFAFPTLRADYAEVTGLDEHGQPVKLQGQGFLARCFQHEVGHLNGIVYTDTLQGKWLKVANKKLKAAKWGEDSSWTPGVDPDPFGWDDEDFEPQG